MLLTKPKVTARQENALKHSSCRDDPWQTDPTREREQFMIRPPAPEQLTTEFPWPRETFDPPEIYRWLREEQPVTQVTLPTGRTAWLATRYDDVRTLLADPRVSADNRAANFPFFTDTARRPEDQRVFLRMDPPQHTVFRRLLAKNFVFKKVTALRPRVQELVDYTIDRMLGLPQPVDLVKEFALPIPSTVLSWILGVRAQDAGFFNRASEEVLHGTSGRPELAVAGARASDELRTYIDDLVAEKEASDSPGEDILGQLVSAHRDGLCSRQDIVNSGFLLAIAGHDTTASMAAAGTMTLLEHPHQLAELKADPTLMPQAIEELLRYLTVVHLIIQRVAKEDIEIGGTTIPAGAGIIPLNLSANRDDTHFPNAATLDIHRDARDHFAFGYGMHQCIGQPLARVELEVMYETLFRRLPDLRLAVPADELEFKRWSPVSGVFCLPVRW
jgi:cytochrome P450